MARHPRSDPPGGIHHVMNRGVAKRPIFFADADRVEFGRRLTDIHQLFGVEVLAYCLMTNHYHLMVRFPDGGLSEAMQHLSGVYTRHTNDRLGRDGPLFRGRFHSIEVTDEAYAKWLVRYIHRNALGLPGVSDPADYRWSSHRPLLGLRKSPAFLNTDLVQVLFNGDRRQLESFIVDEPKPGELRQELIADPLALSSLIALAVIDDALESGTDIAPNRIDRTIELLLLDEPIEAQLRELIETQLEFPTAAARLRATSRARERLAHDLVVRRVFGIVCSATVAQQPAA